MTQQLQAERERACELARQAGRILMEVYASDFAVAFKSKSDPVTEADQRANEFLVEALRASFPGDGIVAEENARHDDAASHVRCWFVDPLDGTKEFIAKNGEFSVMLGLAIDGRARLGVVYQPQSDTLYHGVIGHGALLERGGRRSALQVSELAQPAALRLVVSRSHRSKSIDAVVSRLGIQQEAPSGSVGLKVGRIAEQRADLYVHISNRSSRWDACGPEAVLCAAGGRFTDTFGDAFDYSSPGMANARGILACNAAAYAAVLPAVREVAQEHGFG
jgi:3'(2'), 5'-bisphosphate nucleotidase